MRVQKIEKLFQVDDLSVAADAEALPRHGVADVILRSRAMLESPCST